MAARAVKQKFKPAVGMIVKPYSPKPPNSIAHAMTVLEVKANGRRVIASYTTPDGTQHDEPWDAADLYQVVI